MSKLSGADSRIVLESIVLQILLGYKDVDSRPNCSRSIFGVYPSYILEKVLAIKNCPTDFLPQILDFPSQETFAGWLYCYYKQLDSKVFAALANSNVWYSEETRNQLRKMIKE